LTDWVNLQWNESIPSLSWLRGFFWSFEFTQAQETQKRIYETNELSIEDTEKYIAENSNDFIRAKLRDQAQCLKIIQWNQIRTYPKLQIDRATIKGKRAPLVSDLYSSKSTVTREELESYLSSYVRWQQHLKDEQKLLLLVMILELWNPELLEKYWKDKNILWLLLVYPDFVNTHSARENIFKRWFKQIDAIHDEEYPFVKTSTWGKYLHENFWEIQAIQSRLSKLSESTEGAVEWTKSEVDQSLDQQKVWIEVFKQYLPPEWHKDLEEIGKGINGLYILWEQGISETHSSNLTEVIKDTDKLCLLLIWVEPNDSTDQAWQVHNTLYRLFQNRNKISNTDLWERLELYRNEQKWSKHFSEDIFCSMIFSLLERNLQDIYWDINIENFVLIIPLLATKFVNSYDKKEGFFEWWFNQIRWDIAQDIEDPHSDIWKYLLQNFWTIQTVKNKYSQVSYIWLEEGKDVPTREDLNILFDVYWIDQQWEKADKYDRFLRQIWRLYGTNWEGSRYIDIFVSTGNIHNWDEWRNYSKGEIEHFVEKWELIWMYVALWSNNIAATSRKKIKNFLLTQAQQVSREFMPLTTLIAARLIDISPSDEAELENFLRQKSLFLLSYPPLLKSRSVEEQDNYFEALLSSLQKLQGFNTLNSPLIQYMLRYFPENRVVASYYNKLVEDRWKQLAWISDKFESVWSEKVQRNGNTYAQSREKFERIEWLPQAQLTLWDNWWVELHWLERAWYGRSIHVVIYERSNKGKLSKAQFFVIPEWESVDDSIPARYSSGRYSYKVFAHWNRIPFRGQKNLPEEVEAIDARYLAPQRQEIPDKTDQTGQSDTSAGDDIWSNKEGGLKDTEGNSWESEKKEELFPEEIKAVIEEWTDYVDVIFDDPKVDGHIHYIRFAVSVSWSLEYQSQTFDPEKEIGKSDIDNFQTLWKEEIQSILEKRKKEQEEKEREERLEREEKERQERERDESTKALKAKEEDRNSRVKARSDVRNNWWFGRIFNEGLDFILSSPEGERKDDKTWVFYWQLYPGDGIVNRIVAMVKTHGFTITLEYDDNNYLDRITFSSKEHWFIEYSWDSFPVSSIEWDMTAYGSEICEQLASRVIAALFKNHYGKAKKSSESLKQITQKAKERKKLLQATIQRLKNGTALAVEIPVLENKWWDKSTVIWDTVDDLGSVWLVEWKWDISMSEIEEKWLGIQGRIWVIRAGNIEARVSQTKAESNYRFIIDHIKNNESEFMFEYLFRRIFHTVKETNKSLKRPNLIEDKDSYTPFQDNAQRAIDSLRINISPKITKTKMKKVCIQVIEEFRKQKVPLMIVQPKTFTPKELVFTDDE